MKKNYFINRCGFENVYIMLCLVNNFSSQSAVGRVQLDFSPPIRPTLIDPILSWVSRSLNSQCLFFWLARCNLPYAHKCMWHVFNHMQHAKCVVDPPNWIFFFLCAWKSTESLSHRMVLRFISKTFCNIVLFLKIAIYIQYRICVLYVALSA